MRGWLINGYLQSEGTLSCGRVSGLFKTYARTPLIFSFSLICMYLLHYFCCVVLILLDLFSLILNYTFGKLEATDSSRLLREI